MKDDGDLYFEGTAVGSVDDLSLEVWSDDEMINEFENSTTVHDPANQQAMAQKVMAAVPEAETHRRKARGDQTRLMSTHLTELNGSSLRGTLTSLQGKVTIATTLSFVHFSNENVIDNLQSVGIVLGSSSDQITFSVEHIKEVELERIVDAGSKDIISEVFDKEEKEELENEKVDKLILNSLCCEIMDEVVDLGNAYPQDCNITPRQKPSSTRAARWLSGRILSSVLGDHLRRPNGTILGIP
jgi:hypothetical protein